MKILRLGTSRGSTLIITLMSLCVFALLGVTVYSIVKAQVREVVYQERLTQSQYIAEAGIEDALHSIYQDTAWKAGFSQKAFAGGYYTVSVSTDSPPVLTATGYSANIILLGRAFTTVSVTAAITYSTSASAGGGYAVIGESLVQVDGGAVVDAYDPSVNLDPASFSSGADVWSNRDVKTAAGAWIAGDVFYYGAKSVANGTVQGVVTRSTYTRTFPDYSCALCANNNDNKTGITGPSGCYNNSTKDLNADNGRTCAMKAGTYYLHNLTVKGTLNIDTTIAPVTIYLTGALSSDGSCYINNLSMIPSRLRIYGEGGSNTHNFHCQTPLHAYLDEATDTFNIQGPVYGRVRGKNVVLKSGWVIHGDTATSASAPSSVTWKPNTWKKNRGKIK